MFWVITCLSVGGAVLINFKNRWGFVFWMVANLAWAAIDFNRGIKEETVVFLVFFITSLCGFISWTGQGKKKESVSCVSKIS